MSRSVHFFDPATVDRIRRPATVRWMLCAGVLPALIFLFGLCPAAAGVRHDLRVRLLPEKQMLAGRDQITLTGGERSPLSFYLAPGATIRRLEKNGKPVRYLFSRGRLTLPAPQAPGEEPLRILIEYEATFDDPYPDTPANTDNPGYGVTGIVGPAGTFILAGAGWYPRYRGQDVEVGFRVHVDAPEGIVAVTAGKAVERSTGGGRTRSVWEVERSAEGLALSAGPYIFTERDVDGIQVATYFSHRTQALSGKYLDAASGYLRLYRDLFGPYPFDKFAVVENFFPTGYGFASYTLMGARVLQLPFIVDVSLGHEIAHCWWGNGVRIDPASGNWCEGLTTYVADYLYKERESARAATEARRQWLRNYATLVNAETDFPLSRFSSRYDRPTKVIGYDKSAMVFHMLRQILGEDVFWGALRDIYREKLFQTAAWGDFRAAFEVRAGHGPCCTLENFFDQWVFRAGAPELSLEDVSRKKVDGAWIVSGQAVQGGTPFDLPAVLRIDTESGPVEQMLSLHGSRTPFSIRTSGRPAAVELDPEAHLFRRLHPEEIPAAVNSVRGAAAPLVVVAKSAGRAGADTARMLVRAMGLGQARILEEDRVDPAGLDGVDLVYIGFPGGESPFPRALAPVRLSADAFSIAGRKFSDPADTFFGVFNRPDAPGRVAALLFPVHPRFGPLVARKVSHYGRYSFLAFQQGRNAEKGVWPVTASPLIVRWE